MESKRNSTLRSVARNLLIGLVAALAAGLVTVALPLLNQLMHSGGAKKAPRIVAEVNVVRSLEPPPPEKRPQRSVRQPERARPVPAAPRSGPRFAMDLGVMGSSGAAVPPDIVNKTRGNGGTGTDQGVDERPAPASPPPFRIPDEVRKREQGAYLLLSFCVDAGGRPYDIRVAQEKPPGVGMAAAGMEALRQTRFTPARKGNAPVPFCGLEQPFEIRFTN